uniref:AXH domain-containing protein n=1 Tax=Meloidogyne hapla TaxID=6305 RepID=A0A1I8BTU7_MELHA
MHARSNGGSAYYYQQPRFGTLPPLSSSSPPSHHYATSPILDDEPVWTRADTMDPRQRSPPPHGYQPPSVRGATPQQMTVVHSSAKPVPDSDIYRKVVGRSEFEKPVQFSQLSSADDQALSIDSALGVSISAHNHTGHTTAALHLQPDGKAQMVCDRFEVLDDQKRSLFFVDSNEIGLKLENLRVLGKQFEGVDYWEGVWVRTRLGIFIF